MGARLSTGSCHRLDGCSSISPESRYKSEPYFFCFFFPKGTGTGTSRHVAGTCVWFCTISRRRRLTKTVTSCSSGMTTTATPRKTLSANIQRVSQRFHESKLGRSLIRHFWIYVMLNPPIGPIAGPRSLQIYLYRQSDRQAFVQNHNALTASSMMHSLTSGTQQCAAMQKFTPSKTDVWPNLNSSELRKYKNEHWFTCCPLSRFFC